MLRILTPPGAPQITYVFKLILVVYLSKWLWLYLGAYCNVWILASEKEYFSSKYDTKSVLNQYFLIT